MAAPSVTNVFINGTTADATQVNQNFDDVIDAMTDGLNDLTINDITIQGSTILGADSTDTVTFNARLASNMLAATNGTYNIGSGSQAFKTIYFDNVDTVALGGKLVFNGGSASTDSPVLESTDSGEVLNSEFTYFDALNVRISKTLDVTEGSTFQGTGVFLDTAIFNENGNDVDFRIESDTDTHAFFLQGSDGYVGLGTSTPTCPLALDQMSSTTVPLLGLARRSNTDNMRMLGFSEGTPSSPHFSFRGDWAGSGVNNRLRISADTGGEANCLVIDGNGWIASGKSSAPVPLHIEHDATNDAIFNLWNTGSSNPYGIDLQFRSANPNDTSRFFFRGRAISTNHIYIFSNGDLQNTNNAYGAISDARFKSNILDATPKLDDLMKVKVRQYELKDSGKKQIGVIAQELEHVFPGMVDNHEATEERKDTEGKVIEESTPEHKSVKYSVFVPMLIKAIQEQQEMIEDLKREIELKLGGK